VCGGQLHALQVACEMLSGGGTPASIMALEAMQFPHEAACVVVVIVTVCRHPFLHFLFLFYLFFPLNFVLAIKKKLRFVLLFYDISSLTLNVLIFYFDS